MIKLNSRAGYSLLEIMVVVSIITILASIGAYSLNESSKQARDVKRIEELKQIAKVLSLAEFELGREIKCGGGTRIESGFKEEDGVTPLTETSCADIEIIKRYITEYFPEVPHDPKGPDDKRYFYYYDRHDCPLPQKNGFLVYAAMENESNSNRDEVCGKKDNSNEEVIIMATTITIQF